jgi:hypothetical protein
MRKTIALHKEGSNKHSNDDKVTEGNVLYKMLLMIVIVMMIIMMVMMMIVMNMMLYSYFHHHRHHLYHINSHSISFMYNK